MPPLLGFTSLPEKMWRRRGKRSIFFPAIGLIVGSYGSSGAAMVFAVVPVVGDVSFSAIMYLASIRCHSIAVIGLLFSALSGVYWIAPCLY